MPQVPGAVVKERAAQLREKGSAVLATYLDSQQGRVADVLVERDGDGRTPQFAEVAMVGARPYPAGALVHARVMRAAADAADRRGLRVSDPREKGKGLFGRLLGGSQPSAR